MSPELIQDLLLWLTCSCQEGAAMRPPSVIKQSRQALLETQMCGIYRPSSRGLHLWQPDMLQVAKFSDAGNWPRMLGQTCSPM